MELIALGWCIVGWVVLLGLFVAAPLIGMAVIRKWTALISQIVQRPEYTGWKPFIGHRLVLLTPITIAFVALTAKLYPTEKLGGFISAMINLSLHPLWVIVSATGFWIMRNFHDSSPTNLRRERLSILVGLTAYLLISGWFILLPIMSINDLRIRFLFLAPLSPLFGIAFLRTSAQPDSDKRRPLKWMVRDIAIVYAIALIVLAFPPLFPD